MRKRERLEEEFEFASAEEAVQDYAIITAALSVNYSLIADELSHLGDFQKGLVVDLGTGLGDLAIETGRRYPGLEVLGIDISQAAIREAVKKAKQAGLSNVRFQVSDVHHLPLPDRCCDLVVSHGTIHHFQRPLRAFSEINRVLKAGAPAYLTDLKRDAPAEVVKAVEESLPHAAAKAFLHSVRGAYLGEELQQILTDLQIKDFQIAGQKFSRDTILKNKEKLRRSPSRSAEYTRLLQTIIIRKSE